MKKLLVLMSVGLLTLGIAGCGGPADENGSQSPDGNSSRPGTEASGSSGEGSTQESSSNSGPAEDGDRADGWTDEMQGAKDAVLEVLGENYWPTMMLEPDMLEGTFGISPDMYEDYMAEVSMISAHVDTLVVIKAGEEQIQAAEDALNAYRDAKVNDTLQYPMNVGKIQASVVERHGDYVYFVLLGADTSEVETEEAITLSQAANQSVIDALNKYFGVE